jgi:histone H3/H4
MKENKENSNLLIKKKLILSLKKHKIQGSNKEALDLISSYLESELDKILKLTKEELTISGRKTLKKEDVNKAINSLKKESSSWEI